MASSLCMNSLVPLSPSSHSRNLNTQTSLSSSLILDNNNNNNSLRTTSTLKPIVVVGDPPTFVSAPGRTILAGGFWSHCGWNSTLETVFAGVPILTFPLFLDQVPNSTQIVDEWKNGWKVDMSSKLESDVFLAKEDIEVLVKRFMDFESQEGRKIRDRARELKAMCHKAIGKGGSSDRNLNAFINDISS